MPWSWLKTDQRGNKMEKSLNHKVMVYLEDKIRKYERLSKDSDRPYSERAIHEAKADALWDIQYKILNPHLITK